MNTAPYFGSIFLVAVATLGNAQVPGTTEGNAQVIEEHAENAKAALGRNDLKTAVQEYNAILALDPKNADVYTALGVALYASGKTTDAAAALQTALQLDPWQSRAELFLGLSQAEVGHCADAVPKLDKYFPDEPDLKLRRLVGLWLLNCELSKSDPGDALEVVQKLRASYPDDPDVLFKSAELYTRLWNEAAGQLMKSHPESYRVHQLAGEVFEAQEKTDRAIKEFRLALQENPRVPELHLRIGQLLLKQGAEDAKKNALEEFGQELKINGRSAPSEYAIADIYRSQRDFVQAAEHYKRAVEFDAEFAEPHVGLAEVFLAQHDPEKACQELELATRLQPENASAHYNLMLAYRSEGKSEEANREMAIFQKLQQQSRQGFENKLHSLLTGSASETVQK